MKQAMIFAAGLGTRLKPLTDTMPKALVRVGGQPLLWHVIHRLKAVGVERIVVNVHHFADQIIDYLKANDHFGLDIRISDERDMLLETGGGIKKARPLFSPDSPILIHNVDILSNADLAALLSEGLSEGQGAGCFSEGQGAGGRVQENTTPPVETGRALSAATSSQPANYCPNSQTPKLPNSHPPKLPASPTFNVQSFSGIHVFSPTLFPLMDEWPDRFSIIDFYLKVCDRADIRGVADDHLRLLDVGKLDSLAQAEQLLHSIQ